MIYIYDILLNWFDDRVYEFFEWSFDDDIKHVKRIPLLRVDDNTFNDFYYNDFVMDKSVISLIKGKTEYFSDNLRSKCCALFTNSNKVIAIKFNEEGRSISKSMLLIEEEDDIASLSYKLGITTVDYKIVSNTKSDFNYLTRGELKIKDELLLFINNAYNGKKFDCIKYMYYIYFDDDSNDFEEMYSSLISCLNGSFDDKMVNLYMRLFVNLTKN